MTLGKMLVARRKLLRLTQDEVARSLCVAERTYRAWEKGLFTPRAKEWRKLARHLDISESEVGRAIGRAMEGAKL